MVKKLIVGKIINNMNKYYNYNETKTAEIRYGVESIYLLVTKTIFIFGLAIVLNLIKELLFLMIFSNILRFTGFGVHAKKSWHCWISSTILFIGCPILIKYLVIPTNIMFIISLICCGIILKYAPADTEKRPIINSNKRRTYKIICFTTSIIMTISILFIPNVLIQSAMMYGLIIQSIMIIPFTYKMFDAKYDNYKRYNNSFQVQ